MRNACVLLFFFNMVNASLEEILKRIEQLDIASSNMDQLYSVLGSQEKCEDEEDVKNKSEKRELVSKIISEPTLYNSLENPIPTKLQHKMINIMLADLSDGVDNKRKRIYYRS